MRRRLHAIQQTRTHHHERPRGHASLLTFLLTL
jgi:hypothetical protein